MLSPSKSLFSTPNWGFDAWLLSFSIYSDVIVIHLSHSTLQIAPENSEKVGTLSCIGKKKKKMPVSEETKDLVEKRKMITSLCYLISTSGILIICLFSIVQLLLSLTIARAMTKHYYWLWFSHLLLFLIFKIWLLIRFLTRLYWRFQPIIVIQVKTMQIL